MEKDAKKQMRECCEGLKQLEARLVNLEKERNSIVFLKKGEGRLMETKAAEEEELKLALQRKAEKRDLQEQLRKIRASVSKLHKALSNVKATPAYVARLKETMEDIEAAMLSFKEKQRIVYEQLLREEEVASQDIAAFEKRLEVWSRSNDRDTAPAPGKGSRPLLVAPTENTPAAVVAFEKFLGGGGGHSGGWDDYDHQIFLKVKSHYRIEQEGLIEALLRELPARSREDVEGHEQWHRQYLHLLEEKKAAIAEWREDRKAMKSDRLPLATDEVGDSVQKKKQASAKERLLAKEREERVAKLAEWKAQQAAKRREEEEQKQTELEDAAKANERRKQRQLEVKAQVGEHVRLREMQREHQLAVEEAKREQEREQRRMANREIEKFRQRDMKAAGEKVKKKQKEEWDREEKERRLERLKEKVEVRVQHDPSRVYQLTAGWEERRKQSSTQEGADVFTSARDVPRRAVPSWRQGV